MFHVVLYEPEIPPNTGNVIRLCANVGAQLHLIHPLGFNINDKTVRRAGLDYHDLVNVHEHQSFAECQSILANSQWYLCSTKAQRAHSDVRFKTGDVLVFGPETRGLPETLLNDYPSDQLLRIPMRDNARSLNLSNSVAIVLYEAWRQLDFKC